MCIDFTTDFIGLSAFHIGSVDQMGSSAWIAQLVPRQTVVPCPLCHKPTLNHARPGRRILRHRHVPGWKTVYVSVPIWRQRCEQCAMTFTTKWDGIPLRGRATDQFMHMCVQACYGRDIQSAARQLNLSYSTLERWYYRLAEPQLASPRHHEAPTVVCLDEFALHKGHKYGLNLMDAQTGHVWQVTPGKSRNEIIQALETWPFSSKPKVVVTDLAPGMADTVRMVWPKATVVADKFHVIQLFSKSLEVCRKLSGTQGSQSNGRHEQKLLHQRVEKLKPEEREELKAWFNRSPVLYAVHTALQDIRTVYDQQSPENGKALLQEWIQGYLHSSVPAVRKIARSIVRWQSAIESYFIYRYTNARIEGTHNKIKVLKRRAYGYRNIQRFATRIRLECKPA